MQIRWFAWRGSRKPKNFLPGFPLELGRAYRGIGACWHHAAMSARSAATLDPRVAVSAGAKSS